MKKLQYKNIWLTGLIALVFAACQPELDVPAPTKGSVDFSKYVAVGNSLTAGYADGGLYADAQSQSFPAQIAMQLQQITPSEFKQPDVPGNGSGYIYLKNLDLTVFPPVIDFGQKPPDNGFLTKIPGEYNNLGIPGIRVSSIEIPGYGASATQGNPYFYRILAESEATKTYLQVVTESQPTFFTCWIGNNDVLDYASSGGAYSVNGMPGTGIGGLTPINVFESNYADLMDALTNNDAKGVLGTIPDITLTPFFTQITYNSLDLTADNAALANATYSAILDTAIEHKVKESVIQLVVTEQAVSQNVVPSVATGYVFNNAFQYAKTQLGMNDSDAQQYAQDYVSSTDGQAAIAQTEDALNANLQDHLKGDHANHQDLEPLYAVIDNELATNTALQQGIAQNTAQTIVAYDNNQLPPDQQAMLEAAIAQNTSDQIAGLKAAGIYPVFVAGPNPFVIQVPVGPSNPLGIRQMKPDELILLTALSDGLLTTATAALPMPDQYILTESEIDNIKTYTEAYNNIIKGYESSNIGIFDSNAALHEVEQGIFEDGVTVTSMFILGGAFSLDGVHLTPRGYSIVANDIIAVANSKFGATIPPVNINDHRAVILP